MPAPPQLTLEQRRAALEKAGIARRERAELRGKLKMGAVKLSDLFAQASSNDVIAKMKVLSVLESLPGVGKIKARRIMERYEIPATRRVRGLGAKQREALLSELD